MKLNRGFAPVMWLLVAILLVSAVVAQETTAGLQGTVKDPQGLVVSKATVEVSGNALIGTKKVETDSSGYYRFANLPPGEYVVTVTAQGFRTLKQSGLRLEVGKLPTLDLKMEVGGVEQTLEVTGEAPIVDVTQSKVATTVSNNIIDSIPKGRSYQSVIAFAPGARQEPLQSTNRGTSGFSVDGASDGENSYMVEGMDTTDAYAGGVGKNVPFEFVQEVQIKTSGFEAEHGGALGGVVNVVQKRGGNAWHGSAFSYLRTDALNATDNCGNMTVVLSVNCGLRAKPGTKNDSATRTSATPEYYLFKKDHQRIIEPGFEIGGYLKKDRLWLFTSYVPTLERLTRTVRFDPSANFAGGPRSFSRRVDTHNALTRLDWLAMDKVRLYASWQYGYERQTGINLPTPDSITGQANTVAGNDPGIYWSDYGSVLPNSVYNFGGDITLSSSMVVTARYGYWFNNLRNVGRPTGIRYLSAGDNDLIRDGEELFSSGYQNMVSNYATNFDAFKRQGLQTDLSYFKKGFLGTHNFKGGYGLNRIQNDTESKANQARVDLYFDEPYVNLNPGSCDAVIAANGSCRGEYGYYVVNDFQVKGKVSSNNHSLYMQDAVTLGRGVTLNLGVRFDKEYLPPYTTGAPNISFGFGDKVAPRLGGAWDVMQNGKLKVYGSFGWFYDIMKYSLPRGSFGGDYWHDCVYSLDTTNFSLIQPTGCPVSGPANGTIGSGTFIENVNYRSVTLDPNDPGVDPNIKPMRQTEYTIGADYALSPVFGFETRYTHKNLDRTIEDVGIPVTGNELYYIGNPGEGITRNILQRPVTDSSGLPYFPAVTYPAACPECPFGPKAKRTYDGVEFRLTKRASERWFGSVSYTYSQLRGNYSGLTSSDASDAASNAVGAGGGRHNPNVSRAFDMPFMQYDSHGKQIDGPLGTDRPHTLKMFGWYRLKWFGQETTLGLTQFAFSGTPLSTCIGVYSTSSSCQFVEGRGNFVDFSRAANGDFVVNKIVKDYRSPSFTQTDMNIVHEFKISKKNEALRLGFEGNVQNLFNQRAVLSKQMNPFTGSAIIGSTYKDLAGVTHLGPQWQDLVGTGWNYTTEANNQRMILNAQYNLPNLYQTSRQLRLKIKFMF